MSLPTCASIGRVRASYFLWLIISLGIHGLILALVTFAPPRPELMEITPIVIDRVPSESPRAPRGVEGGGSGGKLSMRDLLPESDSGATGPLSPEGIPSERSVLGTIRHTVLFDRLYRAIDASLYYPSEFKEHQIEGVVSADLEIKPGRDGAIHYRVTSLSPYLRIFIIQRLRQILDKKLVVHNADRPVRVRCRFVFELTRSENAIDVSDKAMDASLRKGMRGDHFSFYRAAKVFGQWKIGPVAGYAFVPSVAVDLEWIGKQFEPTSREQALAKYTNDPEWSSQ